MASQEAHLDIARLGSSKSVADEIEHKTGSVTKIYVPNLDESPDPWRLLLPKHCVGKFVEQRWADYRVVLEKTPTQTSGGKVAIYRNGTEFMGLDETSKEITDKTLLEGT